MLCSKSVKTADVLDAIPEVQLYHNFLAKIYAEEKFESCLIYGEVRSSETLALLLRITVEDFKQPIIFQSKHSSYQIANIFNRNILVIAQLESFDVELLVVSDILELVRQMRIILIDVEVGTKSNTEQYLRQIFRLCEAEKMLNVVAIFADFPHTKVFYSYTIFPTFELEEKSLSVGGVEVFPQRLKNLHGYGIRTIPDQIFPFSFAYELDGHIQVAGYLQKLLEAFAKSVNGSLAYPKPLVLDNMYFPASLLNMTRSNEIDIPMARMYLQVSRTFRTASKPFSISGLCVIAPIQWYYTFQDFYNMYSIRIYIALTSIGVLTIYTLFYWCSRLQCLRAGRPCYQNLFLAITEPSAMALYVGTAQPTHLNRLWTLCILIFLSMVWTLCVHTQFSANLNTFITEPTMMPNPSQWEDLSKNGHKILISAYNYQYIAQWCGELCENLEKYLVLVETQEQSRREMQKLNTSYAYLVDLFTWQFMQLRMRPLKKPIFRLTDMCVRKEIVYCLPLQPNSIFKDALNLFLTRVVDHGLRQFWIDAAYLEAISSGKMHNITYTDTELRPLDMEYMSFAWSLFGYAWTLAIFIFACEVLVGWRQQLM
ncbi:uncharacterized protein LOC125776570 [Bactrocera dorsalis]|uniref:Uncharacterized protein LOC125776570 n=1 Tax=Bactrocera dorsalis TaxID=27457 RepID=A0ABM3J8B3_BACDO|nr:uncharacterized protein LOC125776570 [Bactrocera dorsalis]